MESNHVMDTPTVYGCRARDLMQHHAGVLYLMWRYKNPQYYYNAGVYWAVKKDETFDSRWHEAEAEACVQRKSVMEGVVSDLLHYFETRLLYSFEADVSQMAASLYNLKRWLPRVGGFNVWSLQEYAERRLNIFKRQMLRSTESRLRHVRATKQINKFAGRVQRLQWEFPRELEKLRVPPDPAMVKAWEDMMYPMRRAMYPR